MLHHNKQDMNTVLTGPATELDRISRDKIYSIYLVLLILLQLDTEKPQGKYIINLFIIVIVGKY